MFNKNLNNIYKGTPPLFEIEDSWDGFTWISPDEKDNNIISFERKDRNGNVLVVIINFSGNDYDNYRLGVQKGKYQTLLNTDEKRYGGKGYTRKRIYKTKTSRRNKVSEGKR